MREEPGTETGSATRTETTPKTAKATTATAEASTAVRVEHHGVTRREAAATEYAGATGGTHAATAESHLQLLQRCTELLFRTDKTVVVQARARRVTQQVDVRADRGSVERTLNPLRTGTEAELSLRRGGKQQGKK